MTERDLKTVVDSHPDRYLLRWRSGSCASTSVASSSVAPNSTGSSSVAPTSTGSSSSVETGALAASDVPMPQTTTPAADSTQAEAAAADAQLRYEAKCVFHESSILFPPGCSVMGPMGPTRITVSELATMLGETLQLACAENKEPLPPTTDPRFLAFRSEHIPQISLSSYVFRIMKYSKASGESLILGLTYFGRMMERYPEMAVNLFCIHRFLLISLMIAAKYYDDRTSNNTLYAMAGGIKLAELNLLEMTYLELMEYSLYVSESEYVERFKALVQNNPVVKRRLIQRDRFK